MRRPDGIIFDVDGTMWDSTYILSDAWNQVLAAEGLPAVLTPDSLKQEFGKPMDVIAADLLPHLPAQERSDILTKWIRAEEEAIGTSMPLVYDGLEETLRALSTHYPLFIVSNAQKGYIEVFLATTGFAPYFTAHLCNGDTGLPKSDTIRILMQHNHLEQAVYVGDTLSDRDECKKAGVPFAYASYGFGDVPACDYLLHTPADLQKFFL